MRTTAATYSIERMPDGRRWQVVSSYHGEHIVTGLTYRQAQREVTSLRKADAEAQRIGLIDQWEDPVDASSRLREERAANRLQALVTMRLEADSKVVQSAESTRTPGTGIVLTHTPSAGDRYEVHRYSFVDTKGNPQRLLYSGGYYRTYEDALRDFDGLYRERPSAIPAAAQVALAAKVDEQKGLMTTKIDRVRIGGATYADTEGEADRATVRANGLVVDVIADGDGKSLYVEVYAYDSRQGVAHVENASLDHRHPAISVRLVPEGEDMEALIR